MEKTLAELNKLVKDMPEDKIQSVADFMLYNLKLLKDCYEKSYDYKGYKDHYQLALLKKIQYTPLKQYLTGAKSRGKEKKIDNLAYTAERIADHRKDGLPKLKNRQAIAIYSFYFGGYKELFRITRDFLKNTMKMEEAFVEMIYSSTEGDIPYLSREKVEKFLIPGAKIINTEFLQSIRFGKSFTKPEFYSSKQGDCPWFAVINDFDVMRQGYKKFRETITNSFNENVVGKVTAIVFGSSGSGKSILLKRLAIDLQQELIHIIWVEEAKKFMEEGLAIIQEEAKKNQNARFLVIIEDWEHLIKNDSELSDGILEGTLKINNIRIVIGDKSTQGKPYRRYRNNDFELELLPAENEQIIEKIVEKHPDWKRASERLLEKHKSDQSSLFLMLFILASIDQKDFNNKTLNLSEPRQIFQNIIEDQLKFIAENSVGLGKALFYFGNICADSKISISYETFLHIADHFSAKTEDKNNLEFLSQWESGESKVLNIIKEYLSKDEKGFIEFNSPILAEDGFSKISYPDWQEFGGAIKIQLLNVVTDYGDNDSASEFLSSLIRKRMDMIQDDDGEWSSFEYCILLLDNDRKLHYINKLIRQKNNHPSYIHQLLSLIQDNEKQLNHYAELLWENEIYTKVFWRKVLCTESVREFWLDKICSLENFIRIDQNLINYIVSDFYNESAVRSAVGDVIKDENWKNVHPRILWSILLDIGGNNKEELQPFADKILKIVNCARFYTDITYLSMKLASSNVRKKFINTIFNSRFSKTPNVILHECLSFINDDLKQKFAQKFFKEANWEECESFIVISMMEALEGEERQNTIKNILKKKNYQATSYEILKYCLKTTSKTALKIEFIENVSALPLSTNTYRLYSIVLDHYYIGDENLRDRLKNIFRESIEHTSGTDLISRYLKITKDPIMASFQLKYWIYSGFRFSKDFFPHGYNENYHDDLLSRCLMCFERNDSLPDEVEFTIKKIIDDFNVALCLKSNPYYLLLLKLSFHHSISWKNETKKIIENWKMYDRRILYSVLGSHFDFPEEIETLCKHIMLCWNIELRKISQQHGADKEYGEHLIVAMGHPSLQRQAKQTAMMLQDKGSNLSEDFIELADNIVNKDKYPQWEPYDSDFIDLPIYRLNPIKFIIEN
ncbi:hypothetical protein [Chryseobacterium aquaticum]|uniref:P-loop NTPase n=1 Tax=Chryseobacterium aquaticum TaxID=452084 RepID=UPI003F6F1FCB